MESDEAVEDVMSQFGFSPDWGFVEESPLEQLGDKGTDHCWGQWTSSLGEYFSPWTDLVLELDDIRDEPGTYIRFERDNLQYLDKCNVYFKGNCWSAPIAGWQEADY